MYIILISAITNTSIAMVITNIYALCIIANTSLTGIDTNI